MKLRDILHGAYEGCPFLIPLPRGEAVTTTAGQITPQPIPDGPAKGRYCSKKDLDAMLDTFYDLREWNRDGIPTNEKLIELGLI
ncbi:MAG: hypothetical protein NTW12_05540 [Deltaproteobacteria bacterium]|nr:hypothetical protein [Deltaproteobacteria bacterium]